MTGVQNLQNKIEHLPITYFAPRASLGIDKDGKTNSSNSLLLSWTGILVFTGFLAECVIGSSFLNGLLIDP